MLGLKLRNRGQCALEYMFIWVISLFVALVFVLLFLKSQPTPAQLNPALSELSSLLNASLNQTLSQFP